MKKEEQKESPVVEETMAVWVDPNDSTRMLLMGYLLSEDEKQELIKFMKQNLDILMNLDIFTWTYEDIVGVDPA